VVRPGLPSPPRLTATTPGSRRISLAFFPPLSNGGFAISGYIASCASSNGGVAKTVTTASHASPLVVTGLTSNKSYYCDLSATNGHGTGVGVRTPAVTPI
jgi:hypothetical protein